MNHPTPNPAFTNHLCALFRRSLRGYFAPLRLSPWQAAWRAFVSPASRWSAPFTAWLAEIDRLSKR